jgi:response regulator of citrate/malate metabolism
MSETEERLFQLCEKFEQHVARFEKHEKEESDKFDKLINAQQENTDAISELTKSVSSLVDDTSSIIQLHKDFQGAARVGRGVQGFLVWCLKWGAIGTGVVTVILWIVDKFKG